MSKVEETNFDKFGRPLWNDYFMSLAFLVAQRSLDKNTKHGTIVVSSDNIILSTGYNSPARGRDDSKIPQGRPEKYYHFLHSESAAIINAARCGISLNKSTFYVTGLPCEKCTSEIINVGAEKVIYAHVTSFCNDPFKQSIVADILENQKIEFIKLEMTNNFLNILENTKKYIIEKT